MLVLCHIKYIGINLVNLPEDLLHRGMDVEIRIFWLGMLGSGKLIYTISENNAQQTIPKKIAELLFGK